MGGDGYGEGWVSRVSVAGATDTLLTEWAGRGVGRGWVSRVSVAGATDTLLTEWAGRGVGRGWVRKKGAVCTANINFRSGFSNPFENV